MSGNRSLDIARAQLEEVLPAGWLIDSVRRRYPGWVVSVIEPDRFSSGDIDPKYFVHDGPSGATPIDAFQAIFDKIAAMP